jgi:hypothetical protein
MPAYLLTWNPEKWQWADLGETVNRVRGGESLEERWSSGNTKAIAPGSRVYLLRQGAEPRGIMASGWTTAEVEEDLHWDRRRARRGDLANYVRFVYDTMLNPESEASLDPRDFSPELASAAHWAPFASGTSISDAAARHLEELWAAHTIGVPSLGLSDHELSALEGKVLYRMVRHRSRERSLRQAKLDEASRLGQLRCEVPGCGFDFAERYGALGRGYAQVHHLHPLASVDVPSRTTLADLAIVCANCHVMIHLEGKSRPLASLILRRVAT